MQNVEVILATRWSLPGRRSELKLALPDVQLENETILACGWPGGSAWIRRWRWRSKTDHCRRSSRQANTFLRHRLTERPGRCSNLPFLRDLHTLGACSPKSIRAPWSASTARLSKLKLILAMDYRVLWTWALIPNTVVQFMERAGEAAKAKHDFGPA